VIAGLIGCLPVVAEDQSLRTEVSNGAGPATTIVDFGRDLGRVDFGDQSIEQLRAQYGLMQEVRRRLILRAQQSNEAATLAEEEAVFERGELGTLELIGFIAYAAPIAAVENLGWSLICIGEAGVSQVGALGTEINVLAGHSFPRHPSLLKGPAVTVARVLGGLLSALLLSIGGFGSLTLLSPALRSKGLRLWAIAVCGGAAAINWIGAITSRSEALAFQAIGVTTLLSALVVWLLKPVWLSLILCASTKVANLTDRRFLMVFLRWILVLPVSTAVSLVCYLILHLLMSGRWFGSFFESPVTAFLVPVTFLFTGARVAPNRKPQTVVFLGRFLRTVQVLTVLMDIIARVARVDVSLSGVSWVWRLAWQVAAIWITAECARLLREEEADSAKV
jgi:hypothetical protein